MFNADNKDIIFVAGPICSGKSTYGKQLAKDRGYEYIEISTIVRSIVKGQTRTDIQGKPEIVDEIVERLSALLDDPLLVGAVVGGPRQVEILQAFPQSTLVWVSTSLEERFRRFVNRKDAKDGDTTREAFDQFMKNDNELGLTEVKKYIFDEDV